jgi:hypothetical protein
VWALSITTLILLVIKYTIGLRTHHDLELEGLDIVTHGEIAEPITHWAKNMYNRSFKNLKLHSESKPTDSLSVPPPVDLEDHENK